jgi:hypothetical protein
LPRWSASAACEKFTDLNIEPPVAFTVGLFHDIGGLVLSQTLTADLQSDISGRIERDQLKQFLPGGPAQDAGCTALRPFPKSTGTFPNQGILF